MIVGGTVTYKMAERFEASTDGRAKYVIAMGSCANYGGLFCGVRGPQGSISSPRRIYIPGCRRARGARGLVIRSGVIMREDWREERRPSLTVPGRAGRLSRA